MKFYLPGLFCLITSFGYAQTATDSLNIKYSLPEITYIDPNFLLGIWETTDSAKSKIEFLFNQSELILTTGSTPSDRSAYHFLKEDSSSRVSTSGVFIKWPPDYCDVKQLDENNIEIGYGSAIGGNIAVINYRRVSVKK